MQPATRKVHPLLGKTVQVALLNSPEVLQGVLEESTRMYTVLKCRGSHMRSFKKVIPSYNIGYVSEVLEKLAQPGTKTLM